MFDPQEQRRTIMKADLVALAALCLLTAATPVSARDHGRRDRDYSWRDYDCRRYNRLTAGVGTYYVGRLYPGDIIKGYAGGGWRWAPFI
jgi:hypothetical protein